MGEVKSDSGLNSCKMEYIKIIQEKWKSICGKFIEGQPQCFTLSINCSEENE